MPNCVKWLTHAIIRATITKQNNMPKLKRNVRKTWEDSTEPVTCQFQNQGWKEAGNTLYKTKIYKCSHSSSCQAERAPRAKTQLPLERGALQASWPATLCSLIRRWGVSWKVILWSFSRACCGVGARSQDPGLMKLPGLLATPITRQNNEEPQPAVTRQWNPISHALRSCFIQEWLSGHVPPEYCYCQAQGEFPNFNKLNYTKLNLKIANTLLQKQEKPNKNIRPAIFKFLLVALIASTTTNINILIHNAHVYPSMLLVLALLEPGAKV